MGRGGGGGGVKGAAYMQNLWVFFSHDVVQKVMVH